MTARAEQALKARAVRLHRKHLTAVYGDWHRCDLPEPERGLQKGRLCDDCHAVVLAYVADFRSALRASK